MLPQFDISTYPAQFFWLAIVFATLYLIVSRFIAPKVESIIVTRRNTLEESAILADVVTQKAKQLQVDYEKQLQGILDDANKLEQDALQAVWEDFEAKKEQLHRVLNASMHEALRSIENNRLSFEEQKSKFCVDVAGSIIAKITNLPAKTEILQQSYDNMVK